MSSYKELDAWKKSKDLVKEIYVELNSFPSDEKFGLISQIKRASVSVPANIAEGHGRNHTKDTIQFLHISRGSLYEVETLLIIAEDLGFITSEKSTLLQSKISECARILNGLIKYFELKIEK
jgi:four helix bundle protein